MIFELIGEGTNQSFFLGGYMVILQFTIAA